MLEAMNKFLLFFLSFVLIVSCSKTNAIVEKKNPTFQKMTFDVVTKDLIFEGLFPDRVTLLSEQWFNSKIKVNGLEGNMVFTLKNYSQEISVIQDGKRIDISLEFIVILTKSSLSQRKIIKGQVSSFSTLKGSFSLAEFDQLIENTQNDLIVRLSSDLKSKI